MIRTVTLVALFFSTVSLRAETFAAPAAASGCTRASLQATVGKYLDALREGNPARMPLTVKATYMEN